jgi:hypothetical protein
MCNGVWNVLGTTSSGAPKIGARKGASNSFCLKCGLQWLALGISCILEISPWLRITVIWCNFGNRKNDEGVARSFVEDFLQEPFFVDVQFANRFISFGLRD